MKPKKSSKLVNLNIGCGETKLPGFINIDVEPSTKPDLILDIRTQVLPFKDNCATKITCIHNIEHIETKYWPHVFSEFNRVLAKNGILILAYPEFAKCAANFLENYKGKKDFWRATLYGRQLYPGDYHVTPMVSEDLAKELLNYGFKEVNYCPEKDEPYNTFLIATKGENPLTRAKVLAQEIFHEGEKIGK